METHPLASALQQCTAEIDQIVNVHSLWCDRGGSMHAFLEYEWDQHVFRQIIGEIECADPWELCDLLSQHQAGGWIVEVTIRMAHKVEVRPDGKLGSFELHRGRRRHFFYFPDDALSARSLAIAIQAAHDQQRLAEAKGEED